MSKVKVLIVLLSDLLMSAYQPSGLADQSHLEIFNLEFGIGLKRQIFLRSLSRDTDHSSKLTSKPSYSRR